MLQYIFVAKIQKINVPNVCKHLISPYMFETKTESRYMHALTSIHANGRCKQLRWTNSLNYCTTVHCMSVLQLQICFSFGPADQGVHCALLYDRLKTQHTWLEFIFYLICEVWENKYSNLVFIGTPYEVQLAE